ncbi:DUF6434 domain-containing protein [Anaerofustis stercorihominis]|uniref:SAP domain-containing protein n=1 Tax=Anaerofustis stercorihominis TaxID=214853 RepID=A0A3E3E078_9FIRM|nr:DUF6434 domain-containing protein [Anaerofustis stercorihominis]RGD74961.1 hypothetical protein DW687_01155 [Anaerofustis stercorihominis]
MSERPDLNKNLDSKTFKSYYYLKEELVNFLRKEGLQTSGSKLELTDRISHYLDTGEKKESKTAMKKSHFNKKITLSSIIEENFVCSEHHRKFFKEQIGSSFSFNVLFQKWLKSNSGKTYHEAVEAYYKILEDKKKGKTKIDKQFEYNTYIRDFFNDNKGKTLEDAIKCWKYKKSLKGHNKYEESDLDILTKR